VKLPTFTMGECQLCDDIWQMFVDPKNAKKNVVLGSFEQALASPCKKHKHILESFQTHVNGESWSSHISTDLYFANSGIQSSSVRLYKSPGCSTSFELLLVKNEHTAGHPGTARILDPEWHNLDLLRHWVDQCVGKHADCTTAMNTKPTVPALLVDVKSKRIVSGISGGRYVALSYRCGEAAHFKLDRVQLERLRQNFALDNADVLDSLPSTVRHTIALVEALGERYLWTDSLCITHDDEGTLDAQLEQMAAIYCSALFTIVATDGDGTCGILGLPGISKPGNFTQRNFHFGDENLVVRHRGMGTLWEYHQRGWTYQEFLMSARKLVFGKDGAWWTCQCCDWYEYLAEDMEFNEHVDNISKSLVTGFPDVASLGHLLNPYNARNLTYDEDALPAIAGLLAVFSRTFTGGFLYGLPEFMFDTALGWNASCSGSGLRKRVPLQPKRIGGDMPTWSWLSWQGHFQWCEDYGGSDEREVRDTANEMGYVRLQETSPITEWYASRALEGEPRRKLVQTWYKERERAKTPDLPLAAGWTRHEANAGLRDGIVRFFPDGCGLYVYKHRDASAPYFDRYWYYPFRVLTIEPSTPFYVPPQMRYLFCRTWKSTVCACRRNDIPDEKRKRILYLQKDVDGHLIGTLHPCNDEQLNQWS
jgi:hypothetical protein